MDIRFVIREELLKIFNEEHNWEKSKTPEEILEYINELHSEGYEESEYEDWEWINSFNRYELEHVKIADLKISALHPPLSIQYSKISTELPPIVVDSNTGFILDGNHRAKAAEIRGDETIIAYVGYN